LESCCSINYDLILSATPESVGRSLISPSEEKPSLNDAKKDDQNTAADRRRSLTYEILTTIPEIEVISTAWDALVDQSPCNRAFSCASWFLTTCKLKNTITPHVVVARRGGEIAGVLPLVLTNDGAIAAFASELSDYNDIVAREDDPSAPAGLLEYALSSTAGCRRVVLARIRSDSNCWRAARALHLADDFDHILEGHSRHIRLPTSYEDFLNTRSSNFRKSLARARRDAETNHLTVRELKPESFPHSRLPEAFLSLNFDRWGPKSFYELPFPQSFVRKLLPQLFAEGRMRAFALMKDERLLGVDLCMVGRNSLCTWNGGFLTEAEKWSPGNLLMAAGIQEACAMKLDEYDLLRGDESYKTRWSNGIRRIGRLDLDVKALRELE
jgi:CelD/BcsL family acetyltransferase involved in cellulose biosynthesis